MFGVGDAVVVSFFGRDNPAIGGKSMIYLQRVTVRVGAKEDPASSDVQGTCTYTNPYAGPARISCQADGTEGQYKVDFISDGKAPDSLKL